MFLQIPDLSPALPDSVPTVDNEMSMLRSLPFDELMNKLVTSMVTFAINLAIAIIVFYIGRLVISKLYRFTSGIFIKRNVDQSLTTFVLSMVRIVLYFILIVTVIGILGIETSSFIAIFASAGVALGMALSGTLQNFAGGVLILLLKPYKVGDYIEAQGYSGTVREIQIFHTVICTADNKSIIIPNGGLSTGSINNWSSGRVRRVDWIVSISYGDDIDAARAKILEILAGEPRVKTSDDTEEIITVGNHKKDDSEESASTEKPRGFFKRVFGSGSKSVQEIARRNAIITLKSPVVPPKVVVNELAASSVDLKATAWVDTGDYWGVFYDVNERIYKELPDAGISFPFPQLDVHNYTVKQ